MGSTSRQVEEAVKSILSKSGRPRRVTPCAIGEVMGVGRTIRGNRELLPLTVQAMIEAAESREEFAIRRLKRAARLIQDEGQRLGRTLLLKRAGVSWEYMSETPAIKNVVEQLLSRSE